MLASMPRGLKIRFSMRLSQLSPVTTSAMDPMAE